MTVKRHSSSLRPATARRGPAAADRLREAANAATLPSTHRVIGAVLAAGSRALDLALIETDGGRHLRRIETMRIPLSGRGVDGAPALVTRIADTIRVFMGDRALQPFALDAVGFAGAGSAAMTAALADLTEVHVIAVDLAQAGALQQRQRAERDDRPFDRAEQAALLAVAHLVACERDAQLAPS